MAKKKNTKKGDFKDLRARAEAQFDQNVADFSRRAQGDPEAVLHELGVHQIEIEMQNEQLRQGQVSLEESRSKYSDLFDFAPVGYFILNRKGVITDVNLTGAAMVGIDRVFLTGKPFVLNVCKQDRDNFYLSRNEVVRTETSLRCELRMLCKGGMDFYAELLMAPVTDAAGVVTHCRIALMDVSKRHDAEEQVRGQARFPEENPFPVLRLAADGTILYSNGPGQVLLETWKRRVGQKTPKRWCTVVKAALNAARYQVEEETCGEKIFSFAVAPVTEAGYVNLYGRDITAVRRSEEKLRFQAQILDQIHDGIIWTDLDGYIIGANNGAENLFGYTVAELLGQHISIIHPTDHIQFLQDQMIGVLKKKGTLHLEVQHARKSGDIFWSQLSLSMLKNENGAPVGMIGYALEITDRKQVEQALHESREDLKHAQAVGSIGSWRLDVRKNELSWSDENHRIFGIPKGTPMTYETFLSMIHPEDRAYVDTQWQAALAGGDYNIEHRIMVDGKVKWVREKAYLEFDKKGQLLGGFGITQDITKRKMMEDELHRAHDELEARVRQRTAQLADTVDTLEAEVRQRIAAEQAVQAERRMFHDVLETLPAYICLLSPDYRIPFANRVFREWFGYDSDKKCYEFLFNRSEPCEICETFSVLRTGQPHCWEWTGPNGRDYTIYDFPFKDTDGSQMILEMGMDITELKKAQNRSRTINKLLEQFAKKTSRKEYLDSVVRILQEWTDCQCVGVRLKDAQGWIPYQSQVGFSDQFLASEDRLSLNDPGCLCIRAITDCAELADTPLRTERGSFCSANTSAFLKTLSNQEKARYRGTCMQHGFASLAVIPVRYRDEIMGAVHLADKRENIIAPEKMEFLEHTAMLIGEAVHRFNVEESLWLSQDRLLEAQRIAHIGNWLWDFKDRSVFWSDEVFRILGLQPGQFVPTYDNFFQYIPPEDHQKLRESIDAAIKEGIYEMDQRIVTSDRKQRMVRLKTEVTYDADGNPIVMAGIMHDITEQRQAEDLIRENQAKLRSLTAQLQLAEERQRRQIAQDLHDSIGQILAFSSMQVNNLQKSVPEALADSLGTVAGQLGEAVRQVRNLCFDLSPSILYDLGFEVAIEDLVERFSRERNIPCRFNNCQMAKPLNEDVKILLYRSVRELLINAAKHACPERINVSLLRSSADIHIIVEDNGDGFDLNAIMGDSQRTKGFGLFSVHERLNHIGGRLIIESVKGIGTKAVLIAPLELENVD